MAAYSVRSPEMAMNVADGFSLRRAVLPRGPLARQDGVLQKLSNWVDIWTDVEIRVPQTHTDRLLAIGYARGMRMRKTLVRPGVDLRAISLFELMRTINQEHPSSAKPIKGIEIVEVTSRQATNGEGFVELVPSKPSSQRIWSDRRAVRRAVEDALGLKIEDSSPDNPFHYPDSKLVVAHTSLGVERAVLDGIREVVGRFVPTNMNLGPLHIFPLHDVTSR